MLKDFCQSKRVSFSQIQEGVLKLYADPDLREVFGVSFVKVHSKTFKYNDYPG